MYLWHILSITLDAQLLWPEGLQPGVGEYDSVSKTVWPGGSPACNTNSAAGHFGGRRRPPGFWPNTIVFPVAGKSATRRSQYHIGSRRQLLALCLVYVAVVILFVRAGRTNSKSDLFTIRLRSHKSYLRVPPAAQRRLVQGTRDK